MLTEDSTLKFIDAFNELGFNEDYARVYLASLKLGESGASALARESKTPRSSTYDILRELSKVGLINEQEGNNKKTFNANSPEIVKEIIKGRKKKIDERYDNFEEVYEQIKSLYTSQLKDTPKIEQVQGEKDLYKIFKSILNSKSIYMISSGEFLSETSNLIVKDFLNKSEDTNVSIKVVLEKLPVNIELVNENVRDNTEYFLVPQNKQFKESIYKILQEETLIIINWENNSAVTIKDEYIFQFERKQFDLITNLSKLKI